jgi:hypothetical protein
VTDLLERIRSKRALVGIIGQAFLGLYYSTVLIPQSLVPGSLTAAQLTDLAVRYHDVIFLDAWLQAIGSLLSVVFFVGLVKLSGAENRFAGLMTIIASTVLLVVALGDVTFTVAAAQAASIGHTETAQVAFDFVAGPAEAFDYTFLVAPAPFLILSLGTVLLSSDILPRVFGYIALALGVAFVGGGLASIFSPLCGTAGVAFEAVQLGQVVWIMASGATVIARAVRA